MRLPPPRPAPPPEPLNPTRDAAPSGLAARALDGAAWLASLVPLAAASGMAWMVAWMWWWGLPIRKRVAVQNLVASLPEAHPRRVLTRMMHDLVLGYIELTRFEDLEVEVSGAEGVTGAIVVGGHGGAWDVALLGWARSFPVTIFLRTPRNRWVQAWLARHREDNGVHRLETGAGMSAAYAALAAGRNVFFVQDQRHNKGPGVPFFGRAARTSLGAAVAARKTDAPVYGAWQWREGTGRHRLHLERLDLGDLAGDDLAVTARINDFYARQIALRPHGWLWLHARWK